MRENSTLLAVGGVIAITLGVIGASIATGQVLDTETINMAITGLIGFAAGGFVGASVVK